MTALDDVRRSVAQVPRSTPATVIIAHAGDDEVFNLDAGSLADALGITTAPPREWAMPLGDPDGKTYPPPGWTRTNWRGAKYKLNGRDTMHTGDDLDRPGEADSGDPCFAVHEGQVIFAQRIPTGTWGNLLVIRHHDEDGTPFFARYGHLDAFRVMPGQKVAAGQWLGNVGRTGGETGAFGSHLHFDLTNPGDTTLEQVPTHWPGLQQDIIERVYADPGTFLLARINGAIPGKWEKVKTTSALKIRLQPSLLAGSKLVLPLGTVVEVAEYSVKVNGYTWSELRDGRGWIAREFARPFELPALAPKPPTIPKPVKVYPGVNFIGPGSPQPVKILKAQLEASGQKLGSARIANEWKAVADFPDVPLVIYRITRGEGRADQNPMDFQGRRWTGQDWFDLWWPELRLASGKNVVYQFVNECWRPHQADQWNEFYSQLMVAAARVGVRLTVGDFSVRAFDPRDNTMLNKLLVMVDLARTMNHLMAFNAYWCTAHPANPAEKWTPEFSQESFTYMVPLLKKRPDARYCLPELGTGDNDAAYQGVYAMDKVTENAEKNIIAVCPGCEGYQWWAINGIGGGWPQSNVPESDFGALVQAAKGT